MFSIDKLELVGRRYIVNEDGTVTFLDKRVNPNANQVFRRYIMNEDGTVTFLDK